MAIKVKNTHQIQLMRASGQILAQALSELAAEITIGMSGLELAHKTQIKLKALGARPAFLGYQGYPQPLCVSINDEVVHGIPGKRTFQMGDLVSLDLGVDYQGMITDAATTVVVGKEPTGRIKELLVATAESLAAGIAQARAGNRVGDISAAIEQRLRASRLGIIETLSGHGVGRAVHEPPEIYNIGQPGTGARLKPGMTLAIEPMATLGSKEVKTLADHWTIKTVDSSLAAHFEHTVLITDNEPEVLTRQ